MNGQVPWSSLWSYFCSTSLLLTRTNMMPMLRKSKVCDLLEKFPKAWMCFPKNNVKFYKKNPFCLKKKQEKCIFHHAFWLRISQSRKKKKDAFFQLHSQCLRVCQVVCIWQTNTADENHQFLQGLDTASNLYRKWLQKEMTAAIILLDLVKTSPEEAGGPAGRIITWATACSLHLL